VTADLVSKYDRLAAGFAEASYANLEFYMMRRFLIATRWRRTISKGDSLLELGCGDGFLAQMFVAHGLRYCGVDISPKMVTTAQQRLLSSGTSANFIVGDISSLRIFQPFDAVVSYMRDFFTYVRDPLAVLKQLRPYVRKKIILDLEPRRSVSVKDGIEVVKKAGFESVCWRPFFVPEDKRLPRRVLKTLVACETIPVLRSVPLRWKFHVILTGEVS